MNRVKVIDGITHVWSVLDNTWVPEAEWIAVERARKNRPAAPDPDPALTALFTQALDAVRAEYDTTTASRFGSLVTLDAREFIRLVEDATGRVMLPETIRQRRESAEAERDESIAAEVWGRR